MTPVHPWNAPRFESLKRRIETLPHALLVHGPRGVGKLALAERVAQLLLCEATDPDRKPCGTCEGCRWYLGGNHPDFRRLEPEALAPQVVETESEEGTAPSRKAKPSQVIKIEQVRELADFLNIGSHRGRRRVALVHPAEAMNDSASNALLKGLEEPPAGAMFILVAHRPMHLLATIRSRCVAVPVPVPPRAGALAWLATQDMKHPERWLAYAGGAPLRAIDYASRAETLERLLKAVEARGSLLIDDREELEALAEALQKIAFDHALAAFGATAKYGVAPVKASAVQARAWVAFARQMGENRDLARHPLTPRLFAAEMLAAMPPPER
jgi:DNA polymerase-3 subunit delta'